MVGLGVGSYRPGRIRRWLLRLQPAPALTVRLLGMATALPGRYYTQSAMLDLLGYRGVAVAERMFLENGMEGRCMVLEPEDFARTSEPGFQQAKFQAACVELAASATAKLLTETAIDPAQIGCVSVMTTYGFVVPSIAACLVDRFQLRRDVVKFDLTGSGCCGSVSLLHAAQCYLALKRDEVVLVVSSEIGSQFMRSWPAQDKRRMVINALMGDAAMALLVGANSAGRMAPGGNRLRFPELVDTEYATAYDTLDRVTIRLAEDGTMDGHIDREIPAIAGVLYVDAIKRLLARHGLSRSDVKHWVLHPGSRGVIDAVRDVRSRITKGDVGILGGIGPGMTVGLTLLRWS